jgi:hypothetical protein
MSSKQTKKKKIKKKRSFELLPSWNKVQLSTVGWYCSSSSANLLCDLLRDNWYNFIKKENGKRVIVQEVHSHSQPTGTSTVH